MKKRVLILFFGVILSCGITAGILTTGFVAKYMMQKMIILLNQKKIDKMSFPENNGPNFRSSSSVHANSTIFWNFNYVVYNNTEILGISITERGSDSSDIFSLWSNILKYGISDDKAVTLVVQIYMYDKYGNQIVSAQDIKTYVNLKNGLLPQISFSLNMNKDDGWHDIFDKHDISRIRIDYGSNSFNMKLVDNSDPYSTIEQIRQLSFWVNCSESQLNDIGKKYNVWSE